MCSVPYSVFSGLRSLCIGRDNGSCVRTTWLSVPDTSGLFMPPLKNSESRLFSALPLRMFYVRLAPCGGRSFSCALSSWA